MFFPETAVWLARRPGWVFLDPEDFDVVVVVLVVVCVFVFSFDRSIFF